MHQFTAALYAGVITTALAGGIAITPTVAQGATAASTDTVALKEATAACKAEAKEKKIRWPTSRKYVSRCVAKAVKLTPADLQAIAVEQAIASCKAEAKGKKIRWPASRKYVSRCLANALKDYSLDIAQLRRLLNLASLRWYTPMEIGCTQNVFCEGQ